MVRWPKFEHKGDGVWSRSSGQEQIMSSFVFHTLLVAMLIVREFVFSCLMELHRAVI